MTPMQRTVTARLGLAVLGAAVITASAGAAPGDPERRDIRPADQAWAARANLRAADIPPGYVATRSGTKPNSAPLRCSGFQPDLSDLTITGEARSPAFQSRTGTTILSAAEVYVSSRDERESWRRTARREALRCVKRLMEQISSQNVRVEVTSSTVRAAPRVGERSVSFRIVAKVTTQGVTIAAWFDLLGVSRGRADATLMTSTVLNPPSAALERNLLGKLARRLKR